MPSPIPFGVIGTNWITTSWITAAHKTGKWQLAAVYSRTESQAQSFASTHQCSTTHTSLDSLLKDDRLQAIYIASPNILHYAQAKQALQAKKHVILEKPAASTLAELEDLFQIAKANGVVLIEAFRHIQEANYKILQRMITDEKKLGTIYGASFTYATYSSRYDNVLAGEEPNIFSLKFGGGSLVDIGVYPITFAVGLFGKPVSQTYVPFICRTGVDGGGVVILKYQGFGVQINQSKSYRGTAPCEIYGEKGTMTIDGTTDVAELKVWDPKSKVEKAVEGLKACKTVEKPNVNMEEEAEEFARLIEDGDEKGVEALAEISRIVVGVTSDLRRQNGIIYEGEEE